MQEMEGRVSDAFNAFDPSGAMAAECWRDYHRKLVRWVGNRAALHTLEERWTAFDDGLDSLLAPPGRLVAALQSAGAPTRLGELGIDPDRARWALVNCHLMRDRFTIADLAFFLGRWTYQDVEELHRRGGDPRQRAMSEGIMRQFAAYVFDLDGTVYIGDELVAGAAATITALRSRGAKVAFVTNKPLDNNEHYARKLTQLGIDTDPTDVVTSVDALVFYLQQHHPCETVLTIAEDEVDRRLLKAGFRVVTDPSQADVIVVSFDRGFCYRKLHAAFRAVRERGAPIIATNPDPYCPTPDGGLPDCAAMLAALEACTGARAEAIVGKPSRYMVATVFARLNVEPAETAVVGDRLATDVAMGQAIGATGILVLTGATSAEDISASEISPDHVLAGIHELIPT